MPVSTAPLKQKTQLKQMPVYAGFLLENFPDDFARRQLELCFSLELSLLDRFSFMTEQELFDVFRLRAIETLSLLSQQKNEELIHQSIQYWISDPAMLDSSYENTIDNVTSACFVQKQAFLSFIPNYRQAPKDIIFITREIDHYIFKLESAALKKISSLFGSGITQRNNFAKKIIECVPSLIIIYNVKEHKLVEVDSKVTRVLGYTADILEQVGSDLIVQLIHPDDLVSLCGSANEFFTQAKDEPTYAECRIKDAAGNYHWMQVHARVLETDENGEPLNLLCTFTNVSNQKEIENALAQKTFLLEQSNANLDEFAYIASHDLKEPLRKISAFSDRLFERHKDNLNEEGKIYLDKILASSRRMQEMINDLLTISRVAGNKAFEPCDFNVVFAQTLEALAFLIERKKAVIIHDELPVLRSVPTQIQQVFQHIITNALKFSKAEIQPEIRVIHRVLCAQETNRLNLTPSVEYHLIEFTDNGIGFDNQFAGKIFSIFQRLHGKSEYEGSGIGLTICKKIIDNHHGMIYATGRPGEGSTFSIILPA